MLIDPPDLKIQPEHPLYHDLEPGDILFRIYDAGGRYPDPLNFRNFGPDGRFDHHRGPDLFLGYTPQESPKAEDPQRQVVYMAPSFVCCVVERFYDGKTIQGGTMSVARFQVRRPLHLLDLRGTGGLQNGTTAEISKEPDRLLTQAWARYFVDQPVYGKLDGLIWLSRRCDLDTLVFFESASDAFEELATRRLNDPLNRDHIAEAQLKTGFGLEEDFWTS
jgi:hypothetical protein